MESITSWLKSAILKPFPEVDLSSIPGKVKGKLRLTPEQLLTVIHAQELAEWSLRMASYIQRPRLKRGPGGRPAVYQDSSILLIAIVQSLWRKTYEQIVGHVATQVKNIWVPTGE